VSLPKGEPFLTSKVTVSTGTQEQLMGTSFPAVIRSVWGWRSLAKILLEPKRFSNFKVVSALNTVDTAHSVRLVKGMVYFLNHVFPGLQPILFGLRPGGLQANKLVGPGPLDFSSNYQGVKYESPGIGPFPHKREGVPILGRLVALREAAGKIRIIAIVDAITQ